MLSHACYYRYYNDVLSCCMYNVLRSLAVLCLRSLYLYTFGAASRRIDVPVTPIQDSRGTTRSFYTYTHFYNHARRPHLEKLLYHFRIQVAASILKPSHVLNGSETVTKLYSNGICNGLSRWPKPTVFPMPTHQPPRGFINSLGAKLKGPLLYFSYLCRW
jgi:hypothetical protein